MIDHGYYVKLTDNDNVNRNLNAIHAALDILGRAISVPTIITFVTAGASGVGYVNLIPPKMPDGTAPLYRALSGFSLIAAIDITNNVNLQTSFEQVLKLNDQIKQQTATNLSARMIAFIFQG